MKQSKAQERRDKINLLKDLQSGKVNAAQISMPASYTFYERQDGLFFVNSSLLSRAKLNAYIAANPAKRVFIFVRQFGNEPIMGEDKNVLLN